jgi:hypothetical protein
MITIIWLSFDANLFSSVQYFYIIFVNDNLYGIKLPPFNDFANKNYRPSLVNILLAGTSMVRFYLN